MSSPCRSAATRRRLLAACRAGLMPAEALDTRDREHLFYELWCQGWTDADIGVHTFTTTYTVARIRRERWGLPPRLPWERRPAREGA